MDRKIHITSIPLFLVILLLFSCKENKQDPLRIATAANVHYAIQELVDTFRAVDKTPIDIIASSSGKLTAQIEQGAPYDLFISADLKYPTVLYENGYSNEPPKVYAYGKLILWSIDTSIMLSPEVLREDHFKRIAMANPKTAPYGEATITFLKRSELYESLQPRLVYGENISQTSQFIQSGAADAGFTAKSIVSAGPAKGTGHWVELSTEHYDPIAQGALLLNGQQKMHDKARKFYNFLISKQAGRILIRHGYTISQTDESLAR